ncbi:MAG: hypothetical protein KJ041_11150, partial [Gammaproteobacteria bacterium]|nr:hypothetical protein [Gammaproteobacteria bacterium]
FNLPLSHVVQADDTRVTDLPPYYQERVTSNWPTGSMAEAQELLQTLRVKAKECREARAAHPTANPTELPSSSPPTSTPATPKTPGTADPIANTSPSVSPTLTPSDTSTPPAPMEC